MEWPIFQMPIIGNRMLIAVVALIHVVISHGLAVGGSFFIVSLHYKSLRESNKRLGELAYRILRIFFIITTSVGALTGVGIWLTTATVSPVTIGSLLHIFFWAWFTEWIVFLVELVLIMLYYLGWKKYGDAIGFKIGLFYLAASWLTMMLITGILGAMLTPGKWLVSGSFWDGFFNPSYLPQLVSRTFLAALLSIGFGLFIMRFFKAYQDQYPVVWRWAGKSLMILAPVFLFGVLSYYHSLPQQIGHLIPTALMTL
ncbi:MAG: cytochrome c, partial [bacterium]|nr:cytochrome c [bacterium]